MEDKYVVYKRKSLQRRLDHPSNVGGLTAESLDPLTDAVVIRTKDRFAAPALQAYFDSITNAIEVLEEMGVQPPEDLVEVQTYFFHAIADARTHSVRRMPTL